MSKRKKKQPEADTPKCYLCAEECREDAFCYGCSQYVCDQCSVNPDTPFGDHEPEDHLDEPDDWDDWEDDEDWELGDGDDEH